MSGDRLLASYIVRLVVRDGMRTIRVHDVARGTGTELSTYQELVELFERIEEQAGAARQAKPSTSAGTGGSE